MVQSYASEHQAIQSKLAEEFGSDFEDPIYELRLRQLAENWTPNVSVIAKGDAEYSGSVEEVFERVQPDRITRIEFLYPRGGTGAAMLVFGGGHNGVIVHIQDSDQVRAAGLSQAVLDRAKIGSPWWVNTFARNGIMILTLFITYLISWLVGIGLAHHFSHSWHHAIVVGSLIGTWCTLACELVLLSERIIPRFQLLDEGSSPRARTVVLGFASAFGAALLALVLTLAAG